MEMLRDAAGEWPERAAFFDELRWTALQNSEREPVIASFLTAAIEVYTEDDNYRQLVEDYLGGETVTSPSYRVHKFLDDHFSLLIRDERRDAIGFPQKFTDPDYCKAVIKENYADPDNPMHDLLRENLKKPLQTNRYQRKVVLELVNALLLARDNNIPEPLVVHEYGSAGAFVLKAMAMRLPTEVRVFNERAEEDPRTSAIINMLAKMAILGKGIGVERQPPETREDYDRLKSHTLKPSQLDRQDIAGPDEQAFDVLAEVQLKSIDVIKGDLLDLDPSQATTLQRNKADIAALFHVLPQNAQDIERVIDTVRAHAKPRGLVVVNEYAVTGTPNSYGLSLLDRWYQEDWLCKTHVLDNRDLEPRFYPIFEWRTAACKDLYIVKEGVRRLAPKFAEMLDRLGYS